MKTLNESFEIITPCFCAGADPNMAELRAPSIRGELRWWFRVLGGSPEAEKSLFGGVHNGTYASKIGIRLKNVKPLYGQPSELPQQNRDGYYLFHFANASQKPRGAVNGPRYQNGAWFKPGTTFDIEVFPKLAMSEAEEQGFLKAWNAFKLLGSLGLRQTRGMGAFKTNTPPAFADFKAAMASMGLHWWIVKNNQGESIKNAPDGLQALIWLEAVLGWLRGNGFSAGRNGSNYTPLGRSMPQRQASAIHLRPVQLKEALVSILFYTPQILSNFNQYDEDELLRQLNSKPEIKTPYRQNPRPPDNREEISLRTFCV